MVEHPDNHVEIVAYTDAWSVAFDEARFALEDVLGGAVMSVEHVGSTAVFRDALRGDSALADEYQQLKVRLASTYSSDRMRYVTEKASWVDASMAELRSRPSK